MNFIESLAHNMTVAYRRKDGAHSFWRLDKLAMSKSGKMRLESLVPGGHEGFPVADYKKIYPLVCGTKDEEFHSDNTGRVTFMFFKFPGTSIGQDKTQVVVRLLSNNKTMMFDYLHFVNNFRSQYAVPCIL